MPDLRKANVTLYPAQRVCGSVQTLITRGSAPHRVEFSTLYGLKAKIAAIAAEYGAGCNVGVHIADGRRKPTGFDAATDDLTFNLDAGS